jgi:hypothetical protein
MGKYAAHQAPNPSDPMTHCSVKGYSAAVGTIWKTQKAANTNSHAWKDEIYSYKIVDLMKKVKDRRAITNYETPRRRLPVKLSPCCTSKKSHTWLATFGLVLFARLQGPFLPALRDAFTMKITLAAILRGETLEKADLSDLFEVQIEDKKVDHHPLFCLVIQAANGTYICVPRYTQITKALELTLSLLQSFSSSPCNEGA